MRRILIQFIYTHWRRQMKFYKGKTGKPRVKGTCGNAYRNKAEKSLGEALKKASIPFEYEPKDGRLAYTKTTHHKYSPDFVLESGTVLEFKGYFPRDDWKKMLAVKECNPDRTIVFVFMDSTKELTRGKKNYPRTYGDWAEKHGFEWLCLVTSSAGDIMKRIKELS